VADSAQEKVRKSVCRPEAFSIRAAGVQVALPAPVAGGLADDRRDCVYLVTRALGSQFQESSVINRTVRLPLVRQLLLQET